MVSSFGSSALLLALAVAASSGNVDTAASTEAPSQKARRVSPQPPQLPVMSANEDEAFASVADAEALADLVWKAKTRHSAETLKKTSREQRDPVILGKEQRSQQLSDPRSVVKGKKKNIHRLSRRRRDLRSVGKQKDQQLWMPRGHLRKTAVCFAGPLRGLSHAQSENIRVNLLEPLHADALVVGPFSHGSSVHEDTNGERDEANATLVALQPLAVSVSNGTLKFRDDPGDAEIEALRELIKSENLAAFENYTAYSQVDGNALAPLFGARGHGFFQWYTRDECLKMVEVLETDVRRGRRYETVVVARYDHKYLAPHPTMEILYPDSNRDPLAQIAWVPKVADSGGLNDRHAVLTRTAADVWLGFWKAIRTGEAARLVPFGYFNNAERALYLWASHRHVEVRRFPPVAALLCCPEGFHCWYEECLSGAYAGFKYLEEIRAVSDTVVALKKVGSWSQLLTIAVTTPAAKPLNTSAHGEGQKVTKIELSSLREQPIPPPPPTESLPSEAHQAPPVQPLRLGMTAEHIGSLPEVAVAEGEPSPSTIHRSSFVQPPPPSTTAGKTAGLSEVATAKGSSFTTEPDPPPPPAEPLPLAMPPPPSVEPPPPAVNAEDERGLAADAVAKVVSRERARIEEENLEQEAANKNKESHGPRAEKKGEQTQAGEKIKQKVEEADKDENNKGSIDELDTPSFFLGAHKREAGGRRLAVGIHGDNNGTLGPMWNPWLLKGPKAAGVRVPDSQLARTKLPSQAALSDVRLSLNSSNSTSSGERRHVNRRSGGDDSGGSENGNSTETSIRRHATTATHDRAFTGRRRQHSHSPHRYGRDGKGSESLGNVSRNHTSNVGRHIGRSIDAQLQVQSGGDSTRLGGVPSRHQRRSRNYRHPSSPRRSGSSHHRGLHSSARPTKSASLAALLSSNAGPTTGHRVLSSDAVRRSFASTANSEGGALTLPLVTASSARTPPGLSTDMFGRVSLMRREG